MSSSSDELTAQVLIELADIVGYELARPAEAHRLVEIARGADRADRQSAEISPRAAQRRRAGSPWPRGNTSRRSPRSTRRPVIAEPSFGDEAQLIPLLSGKGLILVEQGRFDEAFAAGGAAVVLRERVEGKRHRTMRPRSRRAPRSTSRAMRSRRARDLAAARRIKIDALGPDSPGC